MYFIEKAVESRDFFCNQLKKGFEDMLLIHFIKEEPEDLKIKKSH